MIHTIMKDKCYLVIVNVWYDKLNVFKIKPHKNKAI